jgi:Skp family chaperone for outer membrane proteins
MKLINRLSLGSRTLGSRTLGSRTLGSRTLGSRGMSSRGMSSLAIVALGVLFASSAAAQTNAGAAAAPPTPVLVVDVARIFKTSPFFTTQMSSIKKEVEVVEAEVKATQVQIQKLQVQLTSFNPGTPEHKTVEANLAQMISNLQVKMALKRKHIVNREAKVYFGTYQEITNIIAAIAHQKGAGVVFNYSGDKMDSNDRASIIKGVNRTVVFQNTNVDITDWVLAEITRRNALSQNVRPNTRNPINN